MQVLDAQADVPVWRPATPDPDAILAFSTRRGGVSAAPHDSLNLGNSTDDRRDAVAENRRRLLGAIGLDPARLATAGQVHGTRIAEVSAPGHTPGCDALVTRSPGLALAVTAADCLPIVFVSARAVGAAHSGWRGTADRLPALTLAALCTVAGCGPEHVRVHLGPCIRGCCYAVGPEVARRFPAAAVDRSGPNLRLDIVIATRIQLLDAGVAASALIDAGACTSCQPAWYFSHRRDAGRTGRHWGVVAKRPSATKSTTVPYDGGARV